MSEFTLRELMKIGDQQFRGVLHKVDNTSPEMGHWTNMGSLREHLGRDFCLFKKADVQG